MRVELEYYFGIVLIDIDEEQEINEWLESMCDEDETEQERKAHLQSLERTYLYCVFGPEDLLSSESFMDFLKDKYEDESRRLCKWQ